ncbi:MAG: hypothetical protein H0U74_03630 [Bradymonadaceae bacterium]|nr:hypothetical protein [Lujinxingiaceae bacterium]
MNTAHQRRFLIRAAHLALLASLAGACAFEPGEPWGYVETTITLSEIDEPAAITISSVELGLRTLRLYSTGSASGPAADFDPANPPPGFSLCHNGHCHADDGSLPSYAEVAAAGQGSAGPILSATKDLHTFLAPNKAISATVEITDRAPLSQADVELSRLVIHGTAQRADADRPIVISVPVNGARLAAAVSISIGRGHDHHQDLGLSIALPADLLAGLDVESLEVGPDGTLTVSATSHRALAEALAARFGEEAALLH